jgi:hypothetical protein
MQGSKRKSKIRVCMGCYYVRGVVSVPWHDSKVEDSIASTRNATAMEHTTVLAVLLLIFTGVRSLLFVFYIPCYL